MSRSYSRLHVPAAPGVAWTAHSAALNPAGDVAVVWVGTLTDYTLALPQRLVHKWETTGNQRGYGFLITATGRPAFFFSTNGSNSMGHTATVDPAFVNGTQVAVAAVRIMATGIVTLYTSTNGGLTWTPLGAASAALGAGVPIHPSTARVEVGGYEGTSGPVIEPAVGFTARAAIRTALAGTRLAAPDFRIQEPGDLQFADPQGNVWNVDAPAAIVAQQTVDDLGVRIPPGSLDTWEQAKREASFRPAVGELLSDSIGAGYNATDRRNLGHWGLLTADLHEDLGHGGEGFYGVNDAPHAAAYPPFGLTESGAWFHFGSFAYNGPSATVAPGAWIEWPSIRGTDLYVWWSPAFGSSVAVIEVDGVVAAEIPFALGGQFPIAPFRARIGQFSDGYHRVRVTCGAGGGITLLGVEGRCDTGVRLHNMSHFGWVSSHVQVPAWSGAPAGQTLGRWTIRKFPEALDLFVFELGGNDAATGVAPSVVAANMVIAYDFARDVNPRCSLGCIIAHPGDCVAIDPTAYTSVALAQHEVAAAYGATVVDLWARSGFTPILYPPPGDAVHPDDTWHEWYFESTRSAFGGIPAPIGC